MTDIVERLRDELYGGRHVDLAREAVNEIERLRTENEIREAVRMETLARQALQIEQLRSALASRHNVTDTPQ